MYSIATIKSIPVLSIEDEQDLFKTYKENNCLKSAEKLVVHNLRYVAKVVRDFDGYKAEFDDLFQQGAIGLMNAVKVYDPSKSNNRFVLYAVHHIRYHIMDYIIKNYSMVKQITTKAHRTLFYNINRYLAIDYKLTDSVIETICKDLKVTRNDVLHVYSAISGDKSLDVEIYDGEFETEVSLLEDKSEKPYVNYENTKLLSDAVDKLDDRSKDIFLRRKLKDTPDTLDVLSKQYGISKERVRQLEEIAYNKVKQYCEVYNGR